MIGLFLSEAILFVIAALIGFAAGWRLFHAVEGGQRRAEQQHIDSLRAALSDAQVRRARVR